MIEKIKLDNNIPTDSSEEKFAKYLFFEWHMG